MAGNKKNKKETTTSKALFVRVKNFIADNKDGFVSAVKSTITVLLFFMAFVLVLYALIVVVRFVLG